MDNGTTCRVPKQSPSETPPAFQLPLAWYPGLRILVVFTAWFALFAAWLSLLPHCSRFCGTVLAFASDWSRGQSLTPQESPFTSSIACACKAAVSPAPVNRFGSFRSAWSCSRPGRAPAPRNSCRSRLSFAFLPLFQTQQVRCCDVNWKAWRYYHCQSCSRSAPPSGEGCVYNSFILYLAARGPKGHGSGLPLPSQATVTFLPLHDHVLSPTTVSYAGATLSVR